jgi:hypothetical protein
MIYHYPFLFLPKYILLEARVILCMFRHKLNLFFASAFILFNTCFCFYVLFRQNHVDFLSRVCVCVCVCVYVLVEEIKQDLGKFSFIMSIYYIYYFQFPQGIEQDLQ